MTSTVRLFPDRSVIQEAFSNNVQISNICNQLENDSKESLQKILKDIGETLGNARAGALGILPWINVSLRHIPSISNDNLYALSKAVTSTLNNLP